MRNYIELIMVSNLHHRLLRVKRSQKRIFRAKEHGNIRNPVKVLSPHHKFQRLSIVKTVQSGIKESN